MGKKITEPEKTYASFGELLNYYMSSAGMTGEKLAEELGYTPETISKYRNDHILPSFDYVIEIAKILGLRPYQTAEMLEYANYSIAAPIKRNMLINKELFISYYRSQKMIAKNRSIRFLKQQDILITLLKSS